MLCNVLKCDASIVLPKVNGQNMFLAIKFGKRRRGDWEEEKKTIDLCLIFEVQARK